MQLQNSAEDEEDAASSHSLLKRVGVYLHFVRERERERERQVNLRTGKHNYSSPTAFKARIKTPSIFLIFYFNLLHCCFLLFSIYLLYLFICFSSYQF